MQGTNMMFTAGLMMAIAVEHCGLHHRSNVTNHDNDDYDASDNNDDDGQKKKKLP